MGQDAAFEEAAEIVRYELRQIGSGGGFGRTKKVAVCCCTKQYGVVCWGR